MKSVVVFVTWLEHYGALCPPDDSQAVKIRGWHSFLQIRTASCPNLRQSA